MKIKPLIIAIAGAATMLLTACGKNDATVNATDFSQYYIAGHYNYNLSPTLTNVPVPYAIIFKSSSECAFVDAVFGVNNGSYTYAKGHLVMNFTNNLVANFDFTMANNQITTVSADGLGLLTYNLEKIPATNAFTNGEYTGTVTSPGTVALAYVAFSASQYSIGLSSFKTPNMAYTLQNNAVATAVLNKNSSVFVYDNGAVMMLNYIPPAVVNGLSDYQYGTLTK
jgi:hypothetical protein